VVYSGLGFLSTFFFLGKRTGFFSFFCAGACGLEDMLLAGVQRKRKDKRKRQPKSLRFAQHNAQLCAHLHTHPSPLHSFLMAITVVYYVQIKSKKSKNQKPKKLVCEVNKNIDKYNLLLSIYCVYFYVCTHGE
jgi:hypothetical protein